MKTLKKIKLIASILILSMVIFSCDKKTSDNNLENTEWIGMANIPQKSEVVLKFTIDRLDLYFEDRIIESMKYSVKNDNIILEKISGGSPCELGVKGEYKYELLGDSFVINLVKDGCGARIVSLKDNIFKRISTAK